MGSRFSLGKNIILSNLKRLSEPYKITFAVTYKCNSKCKTCKIWQREPKNELSTGEIEKIFENLENLSWIDLTGGEIFLRDDIKRIADIIHENSKDLYMLHFPTNGSLTDKIAEVSKEINKLDIPKFVVSISLDGPQKLHDEIRGVEGSFKRALETYRKLKENGVETYFGMTLSKYNYGKFEETLEMLKEKVEDFKEEDLHTNIYHQSDHYYSNDEMNLDKAREDLIKNKKMKEGLSINPIRSLERKYLKHAIEYVKNGTMPMKCKALQASCFIGPKGNVYPCSIYNKKIGNLRENNYNLKGIWDSDRAQEILEKVKNLECEGCWTPCEAYQSILGNLIKN